jgi:hypothetical protein
MTTPNVRMSRATPEAAPTPTGHDCESTNKHRWEPTEADKRSAFRLGFDYGRVGVTASPRFAIVALEGACIPSTSETVDLFCNGNDDGARNDRFRLDVLDSSPVGKFHSLQAVGIDWVCRDCGAVFHLPDLATGESPLTASCVTLPKAVLS